MANYLNVIIVTRKYKLYLLMMLAARIVLPKIISMLFQFLDCNLTGTV